MTSRTSAIGVDIASDKNLTSRLLIRRACPFRSRRSCGRRTGASPPPGGSASRTSSSRSTATTAAAFTSTSAPTTTFAPPSRVPAARAAPGSCRRDVHHRQRLPLPRDRRQGRGDRRARPGERRRRRRRPFASWSRSQRRPAPRHRPREGPDADPGRRRRRGGRPEPGLQLDAVPPKGTRVLLALTGNMSTGGTSIDRTIEAHPDNVEIAEMAARVVGLDVAGIDFICPDITVPVRGLRRHDRRGQCCSAGCTPTRPRRTAVRRQARDRPAVPAGRAGPIPILAVTGTNGKTTTVRMIAHILKLMGRRVGMTSTDSIVVDGRMIRRSDMSGQVGPDDPPEPDGRRCSRWRAAGSSARASGSTGRTSRSSPT